LKKKNDSAAAIEETSLLTDTLLSKVRCRAFVFFILRSLTQKIRQNKRTKKGNNLPLHQIDPQPKQASQIVQKTQILSIKDSFVI